MNNITMHTFDDVSVLATTFAKEVSKILNNAIQEKRKATLLVSGGNTPKLFFQRLSTIELEWDKVTIGLVDERWLEPSHQQSNAYLVQENLLQNNASKANFLPLFIQNKECFSTDEACSSLYESTFLNSDVLILGMGNDGHTASLFPQSSKIQEALDLDNKQFCISMDPITAPYDRMSLTLSAILKAHNLFLHLEGESKQKLYEEALEHEDKYPISKVLYHATQLKVYYGRT